MPLTGRTVFFIDNWKGIQASQQVLNIIQGYRIPLMEEPSQCFHPSTKANSAEERDLILEEINSLLSKDAIEEVPMSELCYSSNMFLVAKKSGGKRPVLNLRPLNNFVPNETFKMEGIHLLKDFLKPNYFMTKLDMRDAYYSIPIDKQSRRYLQFIFEGKLYQFKVLVFGLSTAPRIFTKVMKPVVAFIRARGILIIIYLDDILLAAPTFEECHRNTLFVIDLLESLGFRINREKSELIPSHRIPFLGFVVDSVQMSITLPMEKILSIQSMAILLKDSLQTVSLRMLSKFIGMCSATRPAVYQAPAHYRHLQFLKNLVLRNSLNPIEAYDKEVFLNEKSREDLVWWESRLQFHCSQPINFPPPSKVITSDSSDYGWGIWSDGEHSQGLWSWEEIKWHINLKELMAGFIGLKLFTRCQPCLTHIRLQMDNTTSVHYVNKIGGTISFELCMLALGMWEWSEARNIHLSAVYLPGQLNLIADTLSRLINLDSEWMLNPSIFRQVCSTYSVPKIDLFATRVNNQVPNFVSWFPDPEAMSTNAFTVPWSGHLNYAFPPFSQIMKCLKKIQTDKAKVLLVAPVWRSRPWFPVLLSMLYDRPLLLPNVSDLLILPSYPERLPQKQVTLAVWPLCGDVSQSLAFLQGCPKLSCHPGDQVLKLNMEVLGQDGVAGVSSGRKILFLVI